MILRKIPEELESIVVENAEKLYEENISIVSKHDLNDVYSVAFACGYECSFRTFIDEDFSSNEETKASILEVASEMFLEPTHNGEFAKNRQDAFVSGYKDGFRVCCLPLMGDINKHNVEKNCNVIKIDFKSRNKDRSK